MSLHRRLTKGIKLVAATSLAAAAYLACVPAVAGAAQNGNVAQSKPVKARYSHWRGGCSVSKIADVSCSMRLEGRSASGEPLGSIIFGEVETSRFLAIEITVIADSLLVAEIDGIPISDSPITCQSEGQFCLVVLSVDSKLLGHLKSGSTLAVQVQGGIRLRFPLQDFARSWRMIL